MRHMELGRGRCKESLLSRALARDAFLKKDAKKTKSHNEYVPNEKREFSTLMVFQNGKFAFHPSFF